MAFAVEFSLEAKEQLEDLETYLAERFYPANARNLIDRLMASCLMLGKFPHRGRRLDDLRPGLRVIGFERKVSIYFNVVKEQVFVVGVLYGGRQFSSANEDSQERRR